ncbi:hypothetical protein [Staphylococcus pasteuri]|uniref:hypothetical protein n=1 Tax=Staphylococcus pasteuri TaxID=45972 RepID=UPI000628C1F8|nr:hypothetical protein [Staphylococcus pasteuri]KKI55705.1 hypothetical protein UF70_2144 [Staphylococcus pasteuri]MDI3232128.1 hypothetical protein [Staphylococcus pasteuri]MEB6209277.1 hypothetical protein [Staphylococcus pasteuri]
MFNPFKLLDSKSDKSDKSKHVDKGKIKIKKEYDELALELSNAINLIVFCYDGTIKGALAKIKKDIDTFYYKRPYNSKVKSVNTIIYKLFKQKLIDKVYEIAKNQKIKNFEFPLCSVVITQYEVDNYFE